jgi:hypothetical protein
MNITTTLPNGTVVHGLTDMSGNAYNVIPGNSFGWDITINGVVVDDGWFTMAGAWRAVYPMIHAADNAARPVVSLVKRPTNELMNVYVSALDINYALIRDERGPDTVDYIVCFPMGALWFDTIAEADTAIAQTLDNDFADRFIY